MFFTIIKNKLEGPVLEIIEQKNCDRLNLRKI
jgi:hypothetical protein